MSPGPAFPKVMAGSSLSLKTSREGHSITSLEKWELQKSYVSWPESFLIMSCVFQHYTPHWLPVEKTEGLTVSSISFTVASTGQSWGSEPESPHPLHWDTCRALGDAPEGQTSSRKCECANRAPGTGGHMERGISFPHSCQAGALSLTPTFLFLSGFFFPVLWL